MENLIYEKVKILEDISDEDLKIMQKLRKIKKSAEEDYEFLCKSFTFKFKQDSLTYNILGDKKYVSMEIYNSGRLVFEKKDGHYDVCNIFSVDDIYEYYEAQYLLRKNILPNNEEDKEKFRVNAYFGQVIRMLIHKISDDHTILVA